MKSFDFEEGVTNMKRLRNMPPSLEKAPTSETLSWMIVASNPPKAAAALGQWTSGPIILCSWCVTKVVHWEEYVKFLVWNRNINSAVTRAEGVVLNFNNLMRLECFCLKHFLFTFNILEKSYFYWLCCTSVVLWLFYIVHCSRGIFGGHILYAISQIFKKTQTQAALIQARKQVTIFS